MTEEFKKEVALENEKKKSEAISESNRNRNSNTLQLEWIAKLTEEKIHGQILKLQRRQVLHISK